MKNLSILLDWHYSLEEDAGIIYKEVCIAI
jgi:hypothetical protein